MAEMNGLELETEIVNLPNLPAYYLSKFPLGKVPGFEGADGFLLTEAAAIAGYIAASGPKAAQLLGSDLQAKAKIAEWAFFTETEIAPNTIPAVMTKIDHKFYDEVAYNVAAKNFERALSKVEWAVKDGRKYLVGNELTVADLEVAILLKATMEYLFDDEMRKKFPATVTYVNGFAAVPEVAKYFVGKAIVQFRIRGKA